MDLRRIVVGLDVGSMADGAVRRAYDLAERSGARLDLVHAVRTEPPVRGVGAADRWAGLHADVLARARELRLAHLDLALEGVETSLPPPEELDPECTEELLAASVIARAAPRQKLDLIELHQRRGEVVAMTGDGVNDAPALKEADIGVAMGVRGTQVAREAADMVLQDDELGTIVLAVAQGRAIFANIRKFVVYLMSCNVSEIFVVGLGEEVARAAAECHLETAVLDLDLDRRTGE